MPPKPPFYEQETPYSCAPACLRMVLEALGVVKSEHELRELCDCLPATGTEALQLVDVSRELGFTSSSKHNLIFDSLNELRLLLEEGVYPIVYIRTRLSQEGTLEQHAIVIIELTENEVRVLDPMRGECVFLAEEFLREWERMRCLVILVR